MIDMNNISDEPFDFSSLESDVTPDGEFRPATKTSAGPHAKTQQFPCQACQGTGKFRGYRSVQPQSHCFACGGKGFFMTSEQDRKNARLKAQVRKVAKAATAVEQFDAANPGIRAFLLTATWSSFAQELLGKVTKYGSLSEGQLNAVRSMQAKVEASRAAKTAERAASAQTVDLTPIRTMFETAISNGAKPIYRALGLVISAAKAHSQNPGALYIKTADGEYLGKLMGTVYSGKPAPALAEIAADPKGVSIAWGKKTGTCSCCGAELTNGVSIELGIGPICREKWGF